MRAEEAFKELQPGVTRVKAAAQTYVPAWSLWAAQARKKFGMPADAAENSSPALPETRTAVTMLFAGMTADKMNFMAGLTDYFNGLMLPADRLGQNFWRDLGQTAPSLKARRKGLTAILPNVKAAEQMAFELPRWFSVSPVDSKGYSLQEDANAVPAALRKPEVTSAGPSTYPEATFVVMVDNRAGIAPFSGKEAYPMTDLAKARLDDQAAEIGGRLFDMPSVAAKGLFLFAQTDDYYPCTRQVGGPKLTPDARPDGVDVNNSRFYEFDEAGQALKFASLPEHHFSRLRARVEVRWPSC